MAAHSSSPVSAERSLSRGDRAHDGMEGDFIGGKRKNDDCSIQSPKKLKRGEGEGNSITSKEVKLGNARLPSPTDIFQYPSLILGEWNNETDSSFSLLGAFPSESNQSSVSDATSRSIKTLPPTLKGIVDASRVLLASKSQSSPIRCTSETNSEPSTSSNCDDVCAHSSQATTSEVTSRPPMLLSFPTETVYTLACCVKTALTPRSIQKIKRVSMSSSHSGQIKETSNAEEHSTLVSSIIHHPNSSLEWLLKSNCSSSLMNSIKDNKAICNRLVSTPCLFVCDTSHAESFAHFTKPKTFAIKPSSLQSVYPSPALSNHNKENSGNSTFLPPSIPMLDSASSRKESSFSPLPFFGRTDMQGLAVPLVAKREKPAPAPQTSCQFVAPTKSTSTKSISCSSSLKSNALPSSPIKMQTPTPKMSPSTFNTPTSTSKLYAANFSESREAFFRLASRFWPGPVTIYIKCRSIGEEEIFSADNKSSSNATTANNTSGNVERNSRSSISSSSSCCSLSHLHGGEGSQQCISNYAVPSVPVLPESVLIGSSELFKNSEDSTVSTHRDSYFVGMQCPSHPLSRKLLNEVYHGPSHSSGKSSPSILSLGSSSSFDSLTSKPFQRRKTSSRNGRPRCSIAVVGCTAPGSSPSDNSSLATDSSIKTPLTSLQTKIPGLSAKSTNPISSNVSTSAAQVTTALSSDSSTLPRSDKGKVYVLDGEDTHESFSVPTCQYGTPHPISLIIDCDNRKIHLLHRNESKDEKRNNAQPASLEKEMNETSSSAFSPLNTVKHTNLTKESIKRALLQPAATDAQSPRKGYNERESIDRVVTAVLSRWTIVDKF